MTPNASLLSYLLDASPIVKCVILILILSSIASWTVIFERFRFYKKKWQSLLTFEKRFWSGIALKDLFQSVRQEEKPDDIENIFTAGFQAFSQFQTTGHHTREEMIIGAERAMQNAQNRAVDDLEDSLSWLATVGAVSPFVGLFGTVWGIMTAFQALGTVQQASIAMVAPGISEALLTTAIGLFAAIPAAIAYNRFSQHVARLQNAYDMFSTDLVNILHKQAPGNTHAT
ncbi:MAG: protein TolQ [Gammaproteobacteria bacterium RIFCSPHIGHO2_12_FULL_42_13]|nr:MAG: protein TolQ [Gammaproteobacteria bacterium RIFCSPHIGHO2_12_FULL_42_13]